jgi:ABC-type uncharacterized transport system permease subunit
MHALRQWRATAWLAATGQVATSPLFAFEFAVRGLRLLVLLALWRGIYASSGETSVALASVLTYALLSDALAPLLDATTTISGAFWNGNITQYFLRPMHLVSGFASEMLGGWAVHLICFGLPLLLLAPLLDVDPRPASAAAGAWFALSLALSISVGLALDFGFAALTVALEQPVWLVQWVRGSLFLIAGGSLIPLALLPWGLGDVFAWLPFASLAWASLAIYTGMGEPVPLVATQLGWSLVLWPLAGWLFRAHREKVVGYGG